MVKKKMKNVTVTEQNLRFDRAESTDFSKMNISTPLNQVVSCTDISPVWSSLIFASFGLIMLLAVCGNTVALIIFLCPSSKSRIQRLHSRRIALESNMRTKFNVVTSSISSDEGRSQVPRKTSESVVKNPGLLILHTHGSLVRRRSSSFNSYLSSLAVSDLLMAVFCIPFTFSQICLGYWLFPPILCPIVVYAQLLMVTASALTNTAISLNRLWGILHPLGTGQDSCYRNPFRHAATHLAGVWLTAICGSSVQLVVTRVPQEPSSLQECSESWSDDRTKRAIYSVVLFIVIYLLPLSIQIAAYGFIGKRLWKRNIPGEHVAAIELSRLKQKRKYIAEACDVPNVGSTEVILVAGHVAFGLFSELDECRAKRVCQYPSSRMPQKQSLDLQGKKFYCTKFEKYVISYDSNALSFLFDRPSDTTNTLLSNSWERNSFPYLRHTELKPHLKTRNFRKTRIRETVRSEGKNSGDQSQHTILFPPIPETKCDQQHRYCAVRLRWRQMTCSVLSKKTNWRVGSRHISQLTDGYIELNTDITRV
ncbi:neuropeptide Y receptor [Clonorchis sinensis]|uniref:Neuropeptide Y receptor n=1 Tax=Clonorchis sinensis TaxID=79923 RepID=H2KQQ4_CLOSI|nr:neuropeptide Y receptor [Clonorchis sinensis]